MHLHRLAVLPLCLSWLFPVPDKTADLREILVGHIAENSVAGASVAIMVKGELVFAEGFGFQDLENEVAATENTVYRLASISKVLTATAALQLVERGKLDLDADARTYAPSFPKKQHVFTSRHLLTHTSGIRHYLPGKRDNGTQAYATTEESLAVFASDPLLYEPGTQRSYSTHAFTVLARVIEGASGQGFEEYMQQLFRKAGTEVLAFEHREQASPFRSKLYKPSVEGPKESLPAQDNSWKYAGGGMESSAPDLVRFGNAVLDGSLLKQETAAAMWTMQIVGEMRAGGLGWALDEDGNPSHGGSQQGSRTHLEIFRSPKTVIAVLTNTGGHDIRALADKIAAAWFEDGER